MKQTRWMGN